jgi:bromodomain-containing protein 8
MRHTFSGYQRVFNDFNLPGKRKGTPGVDSPRSPKRGREESDDNDNENDIENDTGDDSAALPSTRRRPRANTTGTGTAAASNKKIQNLLLALHQQIHQHKCGAIFHQPIRAGDAPDYHVLVYRPLDLKTIKARVRTGEIATVDEYRRDISLMFANAMMYNRPSSDVYKMAEEVRYMFLIERPNLTHFFADE